MPISAGNPTQKDPGRAFALQKYLLLHSQHDALQKRLLQMISCPTSPSSSPERGSRHSSSESTTTTSSRSLSPPPESYSVYRSHAHRTSNKSQRSSSVVDPQPHQRPRLVTRRSSLPTIIDKDDVMGEIEEEERKLKDVNQQIKTTLTELLNCQSVRVDRRYRMWVQTRLMDVERDLKVERTRSWERRSLGK